MLTSGMLVTLINQLMHSIIAIADVKICYTKVKKTHILDFCMT